MAINKYLLKQAQLSVKQAFMPPEQAGAPPGAPPMDPSMGGAPPGAPPMDPSMGGQPPMDPSMMGGAPPMDPSMMGGAPPMDPSMGGGAPPVDPTEQIRAVVKSELQTALAEVKGNKGAGKKSDNGQNTEMFMHRIQKLLTHLYSSLGINLPHDILDEAPGQNKDDSSQGGAQPQGGAPSAGAPAPAPKTASFSKQEIAEKAAGIMQLLRKTHRHDS
jgi:hypothetical protein